MLLEELIVPFLAAVKVGDGSIDEGVDTDGGRFPVACCMRQWILNQFDLRPYLDPDLDMPTIRHLRRRQALHAVRFFLLITHR